MLPTRCFVRVLPFAAACGALVGAWAARGTDVAPSGPRLAAAAPARGIAFEPADGSDGFVARSAGLALAIGPGETRLALRSPQGVRRMTLRVEGAAADAAVRAEDLLASTTNYLLGNEPCAWRTDVPNYGRVVCEGVRPGVDVVWHGGGGALEFDVRLAPGADLGDVVFDVEGADDVRLTDAGDLALVVADAKLLLRRPVAYQETADGRRAVASEFVALGDGRLGFRVGAYDRARGLVVDPTLDYSTYFGDGQGAKALAVDGAGAVYVTGDADSVPVIGGFDATNEQDVFVAKFDASGQPVWSTYLGGAALEAAGGIAVDASGSVFVVGRTTSADFPATAGALQTTSGGGDDGFVAKLAPAGNALVWATYLGGFGTDSLRAVRVDGAGLVYVGGAGGEFDSMPVTPGSLVASNAGGAYVAKIAAAGDSLVWGTYLADRYSVCVLNGLDVDGAGAVYVAGSGGPSTPTTPGAYQPVAPGGIDAYVAKIDPAGTARVWATFLAGTGDERAQGVAVDSSGNVFATGSTNSTDFPTQPAQGDPPGDDVFVTKLNAAGSALVYSRLVGGAGADVGQALALDASGAAYVVGSTDSADFPTTDAFQTSAQGGFDVVASKVAPDGASLVWSTYLGSAQDDRAWSVAVGGGAVYLAGEGGSPGFPVPATPPYAYQPLAVTNPSPFWAKLGGGGSAGGGDVPTLPKPVATESFFLPKAAIRRVGKTPTKSFFFSSGFFDTGPNTIDLSGAATLTIGNLTVGPFNPSLKGRKYVADVSGVHFEIVPSKTGSSRAKYKCLIKGDPSGIVGADADLTFHFTNPQVDAGGTVRLEGGVYKLGKKRGLLSAPALFPYGVKATLGGPGRDKFLVKCGFAGDGNVPQSAPDVSVWIGGSYGALVTGDRFKPVGQAFVFTGNVRGVRKIIVNFLRETITVIGAKASLGAYPSGPQPLYFGLAFGDDSRGVSVRGVKAKNLLRY